MALLTITDYILLAVVILSTTHGWRRGFLRSILGPFSLVACLIFSFFYFQITHNFLVSLLLCVFGPILLNILLALFLGLWSKPPKDESLSLLSRMLGAFFSLSWNTALLILFLAWILLIPADVWGFKKIQDNISRSRSLLIFNQLLPIPPVDHFQNTWRAIHDPAQRKDIESSPEYKAISEDKKIRAILADETLIEEIRKGEIAKVIGNPKIQEIFQDPELLKKFLALESSLLRKGPLRNLNK